MVNLNGEKNAAMGIQEQLRESIKKLMIDKDIPPKQLAGIIETDYTQVRRILKGSGNFTLKHVEFLSNHFGLRPIDIFTWPDIYQKPGSRACDPTEVLVQLRLTKEKKDQVLKLVFGENNIEILNR
jgi:hypothetical protein